MTLKTTPFDVAEDLFSPEMIAAYLAEAFATGDSTFIADALGLVARQGHDRHRPGGGLVAREPLQGPERPTAVRP